MPWKESCKTPELIIRSEKGNASLENGIDRNQGRGPVTALVRLETDGRPSAAGGQSNPVPYLGGSEEVAGVVLFLTNDEYSFVTGSYLLVDGGYLVG